MGRGQGTVVERGSPLAGQLVIALHGRPSSAEELQQGTELHVLAAQGGLAVVHPQGVDASWGDDPFATPSRPAGDEDVVYLDRLVAELRQDPRIGSEPIGVVGYSNGAGMALRYAAERPDVAAFVSMASGAVTHRGPEEVDPDPDDETRVSTERWPSARGEFSGGGFGPISQDIDATADAIAFVIDPDAVG